MSVDDWGTTSGLLDDFDLKVKNAWYGPDEESDNQEKIFLFLSGPAYQDGEEIDEEYSERFGTGKGWEVVDEGAAVEHGSGRNKFIRSSGVGRLIDTAVGLGDDVAELLGSRGAPYEAKVFDGLTIHFERRVVSKWKNDDGDEIVWEMPLPTSIVATKSKVKGKGKAKGKGKGKGHAKASSSSKPKADVSEKALRRKLLKLADDYEDFDEFVDAALEAYPEVEDFDDLHADLLDEDGIFSNG